jgi:hypothetical protein
LEILQEAPELHNNLAVSYDLGGRSSPKSERSAMVTEHLEAALRSDPDNDTIRWNSLLHAVSNLEQRRQEPGQAEMVSALEMARRHPADDDVQWTVAYLIGFASPSDKTLVVEGLSCLERAFDVGWPGDPNDLRNSMAWNAYRGTPEFEALMQRPRNVAVAASPSIPRYLEPR